MTIRVLVVDDSGVVRRIVQRALDAEPDIEVVDTAADGRMGVDKVRQLNPDLVTLDIEMPVMDGLAALKQIRTTHPRLPVIMFSTLTQRGAATTLDALALGASDYVTKPTQLGSLDEAVEMLRTELVPRIQALARPAPPPPVAPAAPAPPAAPALRHAAPARPAAPSVVRPAPVLPTGGFHALGIGVSTGGPNALNAVIPELPGNLPVPVLVVQHMPPLFTQTLADRLNGRSALTVTEAADGDVLAPGGVWIAPGGHHMVVRRDGTRVRIEVNDDPPENSCRPAVDPLLRSLVAVYGGRVLGLIMTGMGSDGRLGAAQLRQAGGTILVQDEATSVVWGMPGIVARDGLADGILPLGDIAPELIRMLTGRGLPRVGATTRDRKPS